MLKVRNLTKIYKLGKGKGSKQVIALNNVTVDFPEKGLVFLLGKSGSGKSTLLNAIGGLDTFDDGEIIIKGKSSEDFKQSDFDSYRNTFIGFIFQEYNILQEFSVGKNLELALELQGKRADRETVENLLKQVDLEGYYKRKPNQLSGGQKQRVAIARALIKDPEIIMADEPTGALDSTTGKQVMETLKKLSKEKLVIIVSHDREFAEIYGDRVIELKDGQIIRDETKVEVIAEKSASGVSFIDDKIIHIKKGQKITEDDLKRVVKLVMQNTKEGDAIISFDEKSNEEVKKTAFITDEGNREVFKTTDKDKISTKEYNAKDLKLIKSKLKIKDSFKMGVSSLKHKPVRLILTILLSCFAFALFGLVSTMSSFNTTRAVYDSMQMLQVETLAAKKSIQYEYSNQNQPWNDDDILAVEQANPGYKFSKVIRSGDTMNMANKSFDDAKTSFREDLASGVMAINEEVMTRFGLTLEAGRLPQYVELAYSSDGFQKWDSEKNEYVYTYKEIAVSSNIFNMIKSKSEVKSLEDIKDVPFTLDGTPYIIVGVIKDNTDITKYENSEVEASENIGDYLKVLERETVYKHSLVNMCYVDDQAFAKELKNYTPDSIYYHFLEENNSSYSLNAYNTLENTYINKDWLRALKTGLTLENLTLKDNQVILSYHTLNNLGYNEEDFQSLVDEGLKIPVYASYDIEDGHLFEVEVVGVYDSDIVSQDLKDKYYSGADYVITSIKDTNYKSLVEYLEGYDEGSLRYSIQFASTPMLDNFGSMIEDMTKPFFYIGLVLAVFAGLMLMNFIATSISYKKREIGVLRAIGARSKDVFSIFFSESLVICLINFVLATIGCGIACFFINRSLFVDLGFTITLLSFGIVQILLMLGISVIVALVSSFLPVYKIAKKNPIDSINNR